MTKHKSHAKMDTQQSEMISGDMQSNQNQGNAQRAETNTSRASRKAGSK